MRNKLAMALCLISMVGICEVGIGGNQDRTSAPVGDEDGFFGTTSGSWEPEAAAGFPAPVEKTGQKISYGARDDGMLRKGVAWPKPRFKDNENGTVTDKLTGLIWLKDACCGKFWATDATGQNARNWDSALTAAKKLESGACELTDGSVAGNWRLPNKKELESLIHIGFYNPALPNRAGTGKWTDGNPFSGVQSYYYWLSSTVAFNTVYVWVADLGSGFVGYNEKGSTFFVWPVRGGQ